MVQISSSSRRRIRRTWEQINNFRDSGAVESLLDQTILPILDNGRQAVCSVITSTPSAVIENPFSIALEQFWSDTLRCDLDEEDRPEPNWDDGVEDGCIAFTGGQREIAYGVNFEAQVVQEDLRPDEDRPDPDEPRIQRFTRTANFDGSDSFNTLNGPIQSLCIETDSGTTYSANLVGTQANGQERSQNIDSAATGTVFQLSIRAPLPEGEGFDDPDFLWIITRWEVEVFPLDEEEEDTDDVTDPDEIPPPFKHPDPDRPPEQKFDITIENPPQYPQDFPEWNITVNYNPETKKVEGDDFEIVFDQEGASLEFSPANPPDFLTPLLDAIGEVADIAGDTLPAPFDFIPDLVADALDGDEDEEEEEEPIEIDVDRKSCEQGELKITTETIAVLPSQERVVREIIESQNRIEEVRCSVGAFKAVKVEITEFPVRGKARFGDSPEQSRFFFGWIQFTREGEMFGAPQILEFNPQTFSFPLEADDFLIQFIDGAEGETEVIDLE